MKSKQQGGFTLIELIVSTAIAAIITIASLPALVAQIEDAGMEGTGAYMAYVKTGIERYNLKNHDSLADGTAQAAVVPAVVDAYAPTIAELVRDKYIGGSSLTDTTPQRQQIKTLITTPNCPGPNCSIVGLAYTTTPMLKAGTTNVRYDLLSTYLASPAIQGAGLITKLGTDGSILAGNSGINLPNPLGAVPGVLAVSTYLDEALYANFVRRFDTRDPSLLGNLTVAGTVTAGTVTAASIQAISMIVSGAAAVGQLNLSNTVVAGTGCSPEGAVSKDATGALMSCRGGVWFMLTQCLPFSGDLNTLETSGCFNGFGFTNAPGGSGDWFFVEVLRHYNVTNFYTIQRATGMTGASSNGVWTRNQQSATINTGWGSWTKAVTSDSAGTVALTALQLDGTVVPGSACSVPGGSSIVRAVAGGGMANCVNGLWASVVPTATPGAACSLNGVQYVSNVDGRTLVCRNGVNMQVDDLYSSLVLMQTTKVFNGDQPAKPTCGQLGVSTGTPIGILTGTVESSSDVAFNRRLYDVAPNNWYVALYDNTGTATGSAILSAYCYY